MRDFRRRLMCRGIDGEIVDAHEGLLCIIVSVDNRCRPNFGRSIRLVGCELSFWFETFLFLKVPRLDMDRLV